VLASDYLGMRTSDRDRWFVGLALALQGLHSPDRVIAGFRNRVPEFARRAGVVWLWDPERRVLRADGGQEWAPDSEVSQLVTAGGSTTMGATVVMGLRAFDHAVGALVMAADAVPPDEALSADEWARLCEILGAALADARDDEVVRKSAALLESLIEQVPAIAYVAAPVTGAPIYVSPQLERLFGVPVSQWLGGVAGWAQQVHPDDREATSTAYAAAVAACESFEGEYRLIDAAGDVRWVSDLAETLRDENGEPTAVHGMIFDITKHKLAEQALKDSQVHVREAEERYRNLVERLPLAIYVDALDAKATSIYNSPQNAEITGYTHEQWVADPDLFAKAVHPEDRDRVMAALGAAHDSNSDFCCEYRIVRPDGSERWVRDESVVVPSPEGAPLYRQGYLLDITPRKQAEDRLAHLAYHDPLTGLPNRAMFREHLEKAVARAERSGRGVAVLFLDLDDFKLVNDGFGHGAGDDLLRAVALRLSGAVRPSDVVARQGGDEFLILLSDLDPGDGSAGATTTTGRVASKLVDSLQAPFAIANTNVYVTPSIGASLFPADGDSAETLLKHADIAMYTAKDGGRDGYRLYQPPKRDLSGELAIASQLRQAERRDELELYYQPIVDLSQSCIVGAEALIRWNHPERGLLLPGDFLPAAERTGLIRPITAWVLEQACIQARRWCDQDLDLYASINIPPAYWQPTAIRRMIAMIESFGLDADRIMIEVTEEAAMNTGTELNPMLAEIHSQGLRLAIDDFGTGYSSLERLRRLRPSMIKIDRSFVRDLPADHDAGILVETMVTMAQKLGIKCLAEGIETEAQLRFLLDNGCPLGQGYLYSRPLPASEFNALMAIERRAA
jgi:diguanylate cyclase (GGDEF)-like protein/PAS domain S-box-containing protein